MTAAQRSRLLCAWLRYKTHGCCGCCHYSDDPPMPSRRPRSADDVISAGNEYSADLTSTTSAPPSYDVAITMPRAKTSTTIKFIASDGNLYEFKMAATGTSMDASCEPPRLVSESVEVGQLECQTAAPAAATRRQGGWLAALISSAKGKFGRTTPTSGSATEPNASPASDSASVRPASSSVQMPPLLTSSNRSTVQIEVTSQQTNRTSVDHLLEVPVATNSQAIDDGSINTFVRF